MAKLKKKNTRVFSRKLRVKFQGVKVQSNLYIPALYIAVTLCITVTKQLPKNHPLYLLLKGHCHAIWQFYKKLEGVFASIEFQN